VVTIADPDVATDAGKGGEAEMRRHALVDEVVGGARVDERNELEAAQVDVQLQLAVLRRTHARECSDEDHPTICGERGLKGEERMQGVLSVARPPS